MENKIDPIDVQVLDRFLAGECDPVEAGQVRHWMAGRGDRAALVAALDHAGLTDESRRAVVNTSQWWAVVRERIAAHPPVEAGGERSLQATSDLRSRVVPRGVWYAVAGVMASVLAMFAWQRNIAFFAKPAFAPTMVTTYTTRPGERADVALPDGSTITLNVGSRVDIPMDFGKGNRTVRLDGQALFTVKHTSETPFTVVSGRTTTRVLGTTFMVRRYTTDSAATVSVRDGKVAVQSVVLTAHEQAVHQSDGSVRVSMADSTQFTFASGVLSFDWVPLPQAIVELNRWYNVDIRIGDSVLSTHHIKAAFGTGSKSDLVAILELALNARVVRDGQVLTLYRK